jgi:hypothetical protein
MESSQLRFCLSMPSAACVWRCGLVLTGDSIRGEKRAGKSVHKPGFQVSGRTG